MSDTWQICPKCTGQGTVSKPEYITGDVYEWSSISTIHLCDVCRGKKIISTITGLPPNWDSTTITDLTPENNPFKTGGGILKIDFYEVKDFLINYTNKKVPVYKDCPNIGLGTCFCSGTCKEIIGYKNE